MEQASFNFVTAVTILGDFSRPKCVSQLQAHPSIPALGCWGWDSAHQGELEGSCLARGLEGTDSLGSSRVPLHIYWATFLLSSSGSFSLQ